MSAWLVPAMPRLGHWQLVWRTAARKARRTRHVHVAAGADYKRSRLLVRGLASVPEELAA